MTRKDIVQIGAWAAATAVVAVGLAIGHTAIGDNETRRPAGPVTVVDGLRISMTATPSAANPQRVTLDVAVENPTDKAITLGSKVTVVRQEYSGNPMSRAPIAADFKRVPIVSKRLYGVYAPGRTRTVRLTDTLPEAVNTPTPREGLNRATAGGGAASRTAPAPRPRPTVTYGISVADGSGRMLPIAGVRPTVMATR